MTELWSSQRIKFIKYFKLKETRFSKLFIKFGDDDDIEAQTFQAVEDLLGYIDLELELDEWRAEIREINRRFE